jgi:hypothetical protein
MVLIALTCPFCGKWVSAQCCFWASGTVKDMSVFLNAHRSFKRDSLQEYFDLFAFVSNSPIDPLEKVEQIVNLAFANPKLLC